MKVSIAKKDIKKRENLNRKFPVPAQAAFSFLNPLKATTTMPVITLCEGKENNFVCPIRELCLRYKAKADPNFQSWFACLPYNAESETCDSFMALEKAKKSRNIEWRFFESVQKIKSYS